ncbi:MAG: hypothetical protein ABI597_12850, partial [Gammaproteobacteria bacterium]
AALYEQAPTPAKGQVGRRPEKVKRTPMLMSLFSLTCLFAIEMLKSKSLPILSSAWYDKKDEATFADILAFVRRDIWVARHFNDSTFEGDYVKIRPEDWDALLNQLARAA